MGAVAAAALTTMAASAALAQEKRPEQDRQAPAAHRVESGQKGQMNGERTGQSAQAQTGEPNKEERARESGQAMKPGVKGEGAQGEQPRGEQQRGNQAQSENPNRTEEQKGAQAQERNGQPEKGAQTEERKGQNEKGAQTEERKGQSEKGAQAQERNGQNEKGAQTEERNGQSERGAQAQERNGQNEKGAQTGAMQNREGQGQTGRNDRQGAGAANAQAMGRVQLPHDRAARIAQTLTATARPQNINVNVSVGADLPGDVDLMPLPSDVVELVPEFRDYDFVVVNDEIVIVDPSTRRVAEVIRESGGGETEAMATTRVNPCGP
jgi:hypothetical protein